MVGFTLRFDPRYYLVHEAVQSGAVGEMVYMYARRNNILASARRLGGRVTLPFFLQVHDIDAMRWMGGAEVERVYACSARKVLTDLGVDDVVLTSLHFSDGSIGCVESNWIMPDALPSRFDFRLEIIGTKGKADLELQEQGAFVFDGERLQVLDPMFRPTLYDGQPLVLREELRHFVHCVLCDRQPVVGGADGRAATAVALAIERSLRQGVPVSV
jgi:predicted dehydrogenase